MQKSIEDYCSLKLECVKSPQKRGIKLLKIPYNISTYFHTHNLKDGSGNNFGGVRWAERSERFRIRALRSARKVNWSRCFSPARCTIADCAYVGVTVRGVLLWGACWRGLATRHLPPWQSSRGSRRRRCLENIHSDDGMKSRGVQRVIHSYS